MALKESRRRENGLVPHQSVALVHSCIEWISNVCSRGALGPAAAARSFHWMQTYIPKFKK